MGLGRKLISALRFRPASTPASADATAAVDRRTFDEARRLSDDDQEPEALVLVDRMLGITGQRWEPAIAILNAWPTDPTFPKPVETRQGSEWIWSVEFGEHTPVRHFGKVALLELLRLRSICFSAIMYGSRPPEVKDPYFLPSMENLIIVQGVFPSPKELDVARLWLVALQAPLLSRNPDVVLRPLQTMATCLANHPDVLPYDPAVKHLVAVMFPKLRRELPADHECVKKMNDTEEFIRTS